VLEFYDDFQVIFNIYESEWITKPFDVFGRLPVIYVEFKYLLNKLR